MTKRTAVYELYLCMQAVAEGAVYGVCPVGDMCDSHEGSRSRGLHTGKKGQQGAVHLLQLTAQLDVSLLTGAAGTPHLPHLRPCTPSVQLLQHQASLQPICKSLTTGTSDNQVPYAVTQSCSYYRSILPNCHMCSASSRLNCIM